MKYKALITGNNYSIIDDFFGQMDDDVEVLTTSSRYKDIINHLQYFEPDFFVYCLFNEPRERVRQMTNVKYRLARSRIPFILIGEKEDCDEFEKLAVNVSDLTLLKPLTVDAISKSLFKFIKDWKLRDQELAEANGQKASPADDSTVSDLLFALENFSAADVISSLGSGQPAAPVYIPTQRKHILVVDDAAVMLKTIKEYLHNDYDVATAVSGKIAMKFLERKRTDLILLDYEMPEENGPAVLEKLRAQEYTRDIPVIFLTGVSDSRKIKEVLSLKPQGYLLKPIDRAKLMDAIKGVIG